MRSGRDERFAEGHVHGPGLHATTLGADGTGTLWSRQPPIWLRSGPGWIPWQSVQAVPSGL